MVTRKRKASHDYGKGEPSAEFKPVVFDYLYFLQQYMGERVVRNIKYYFYYFCEVEGLPSHLPPMDYILILYKQHDREIQKHIC